MRIVLAALLLFTAMTGPVHAGDAMAGAQVFKKCGACHTAVSSDNRIGPSLMGVVGRPVASVASYTYSTAMAAFGADGKVWDEARLAAYLVAPRAMVQGTKMSFPGLKRDKDIADVIAYLKTAGTAAKPAE